MSCKENPSTRRELAYEVAKQVERYLNSMASSRYREIARPVSPQTEPQKTYALDVSTFEHWRIGEGFMTLDNMFLVRLISVSRGSFQPEIWVMEPMPSSLPPIRPTTTSEDRAQLGKGPLELFPSSQNVSAGTAPSTLEGSEDEYRKKPNVIIADYSL